MSQEASLVTLCRSCVSCLAWLNWSFINDVKSPKTYGIFVLECIHCLPNNQTRVILNILYSCKSIAIKFSTWYPDGLSY